MKSNYIRSLTIQLTVQYLTPIFTLNNRSLRKQRVHGAKVIVRSNDINGHTYHIEDYYTQTTTPESNPDLL